MESRVLDPTTEEIRSILPVAQWQKLARMVRDSHPDIVILVARKMPRIAQCLQLDFGTSCIISDIAIPYCHRILRGARVAIVDDVINVGSTMANARARVLSCGAQEPLLFAVARREGGHPLLAGRELRCVHDSPLGHTEMALFAKSIPVALAMVDKPYDLEFPIIPCAFAVPFTRASDIVAQVRYVFGQNNVIDLSHWRGRLPR